MIREDLLDDLVLFENGSSIGIHPKQDITVWRPSDSPKKVICTLISAYKVNCASELDLWPMLQLCLSWALATAWADLRAVSEPGWELDWRSPFLTLSNVFIYDFGLSPEIFSELTFWQPRGPPPKFSSSAVIGDWNTLDMAVLATSLCECTVKLFTSNVCPLKWSWRSLLKYLM